MKKEAVEFINETNEDRTSRKREANNNLGVYDSSLLRIGMTQDEVIDDAWGKPVDINRTTTAYGVSEQWLYKGYKYLYFEDGLLTAIQD